ncbi:hypothetical protein LOTGIDRAFT_204921 [Lottia gigantea]|uniref:IF rod domain-containing protein n=1 Tax=Lottia gigantea TaxID=225164 RepID=V3ZIH5_LOTGI|nr:hypothetical protein LOTGIDRAFT_204921 [Lottia gigantea]ESO82120.1 hypothetical protein LOTGIDRAFT_204921 [Lottia gigantea]
MSKQSLSRSQEGDSGFIKRKTVVIQRGGAPASNSYGYSRQSMSFGNIGLAPGTYSTISHEGVNDMKGKRQHEKKEMQNLNERFGNYIEKVRFLETFNAQLENELEAYRNQKHTDFKPIRDMYENELAQARKVIDELSAEKGGYDAKMAGLQDLVDTLRKEIEILESHAKDYRATIDNQAAQIGGFEGELQTLRNRIANLENENDKVRQLNNQRSEENRRLRTDLDNETAAHIEADCRASGLEEEVEFLRALLDKMPAEPQPVKIKGLDLKDFWQNNMSKAIRDIQNEYDNKLDLMRQDCETRYSAQIRQVQSGAVRDNFETQQAKEEIKKLKTTLNSTNARIADLEARNASLQAELNEQRGLVKSLELELDEAKHAHMTDKQRLQSELEACLEELRMITDAKLSLELEISCYRQLLEGEENRLGLKNIVEQAMGIQTKGSTNLASIVGGGSSGGRSETRTESTRSIGGGGSGSSVVKTTTTTVKSSSSSSGGRYN